MKFTRSIDLYIVNLNWLRWWANFLGLDITEANYKGNIRTYVAMTAIFIYVFGMWYTVWFYWANWIKLVEAATIYALACQGMVKIYTVYRYHYFFVNMYARLEKFHREQTQHSKNNASLLSNIHRIRQVSKLISLQYSLMCAIYALTPIAVYLYNGEKVLCFGYLLPFTDPDIPLHYFLNVAYQHYVLFVAWAGFSASESVIVLFVASLAGYVDVLKNTVDEMNECLLRAGYGNDRKEVREKLLEIARLHQRVLEYEQDLEERYYLNNWVQVFSDVFTVTSALFHCLINQQFQMYALTLTAVMQLFELCLLGTILSVKNEEIESVFYNSLWYLMNRSEQKTFLILFHKSQHAIEMTVANMAPLSVVTYLAILRKIYAVSMMLLSLC
uniref:Uncharacterized protein n=2 Tax=Anopheles albimanus TaxID=7167 RepID=A0A182FTH4_ANOAL